MSTGPADSVNPAYERANRLYWETDDRVDDIATTVGISRRALYNALEPLPAGVACAECGEPAAFPNRTRRDAGEAVCPACDVVTPVEAAPPAAAPPERHADEVEQEPEGETTISRAVPPAAQNGSRLAALAEVTPERAALIGGAAALGVAVGTVAVRTLRRR